MLSKYLGDVEVNQVSPHSNMVEQVDRVIPPKINGDKLKDTQKNTSTPETQYLTQRFYQTTKECLHPRC